MLPGSEGPAERSGPTGETTMYQFSRSIYRELAPDILEDRLAPTAAGNHERVLRACEAAVYRLATDWHYFAQAVARRCSTTSGSTSRCRRRTASTGSSTAT